MAHRKISIWTHVSKYKSTIYIQSIHNHPDSQFGRFKFTWCFFFFVCVCDDMFCLSSSHTVISWTIASRRDSVVSLLELSPGRLSYANSQKRSSTMAFTPLCMFYNCSISLTKYIHKCLFSYLSCKHISYRLESYSWSAELTRVEKWMAKLWYWVLICGHATCSVCHKKGMKQKTEQIHMYSVFSH